MDLLCFAPPQLEGQVFFFLVTAKAATTRQVGGKEGEQSLEYQCLGAGAWMFGRERKKLNSFPAQMKISALVICTPPFTQLSGSVNTGAFWQHF